MFRISKNDNDLKEAKKLDKILQPIHTGLFVESNPCPAKYALSLLNLCTEEVRLPLVKITDESKKVVRSALLNAKLI